MNGLALHQAHVAFDAAASDTTDGPTDEAAPSWTDEREAAWRAWGRRTGEGAHGGIAIPVTRPTRRGPWLPRLLDGGRTSGA